MYVYPVFTTNQYIETFDEIHQFNFGHDVVKETEAAFAKGKKE